MIVDNPWQGSFSEIIGGYQFYGAKRSMIINHRLNESTSFSTKKSVFELYPYTNL